MTIDEAIERLKSNAIIDKYNMQGYSMQEHEQLAEWLEELKELKKKWLESDAYNEGLKDGRQGAIDKCIKYVNEWDSVIADALAKHFKEQIKEGKE